MKFNSHFNDGGEYQMNSASDDVDPLESALCEECGYALKGLALPRCPECGRAFDPKGTPSVQSQLSGCEWGPFSLLLLVYFRCIGLSWEQAAYSGAFW